MSEQKLRPKCCIDVNFLNLPGECLSNVWKICTVTYGGIFCSELFSFPSSGTRLNLHQRNASLVSKSYTGVTAFAIRQELEKSCFVWEWDTPWPGEHLPSPLPSLLRLEDFVLRHFQASPPPQSPCCFTQLDFLHAFVYFSPIPMQTLKCNYFLLVVQRKCVAGFQYGRLRFTDSTMPGKWSVLNGTAFVRTNLARFSQLRSFTGQLQL